MRTRKKINWQHFDSDSLIIRDTEEDKKKKTAFS